MAQRSLMISDPVGGSPAYETFEPSVTSAGQSLVIKISVMRKQWMK